MENLEATTTPEEDKKTALDRARDFTIELTQTVLALGITAIMGYMAIVGLANENISNAFFLIVGFYFGKQFKSGAVGLSIRAIKTFKKHV